MDPEQIAKLITEDPDIASGLPTWADAREAIIKKFDAIPYKSGLKVRLPWFPDQFTGGWLYVVPQGDHIHISRPGIGELEALRIDNAPAILDRIEYWISDRGEEEAISARNINQERQPGRNKEIYELYFGIGREKMPRREIAKLFGLSPERVRQTAIVYQKRLGLA